MRLPSDAVARGVKGLAGAAVEAARRSAPPRAWRFGVESSIKLLGTPLPLEKALDGFREALRREHEELRIAAGELVRTRNGLIDAEDLDGYMRKENYLPPGCDRTWEGTVVLEIDVTHPDPSAAPSPWAVLPAGMGRFTAFRWETYNPAGDLLTKGEFPVPDEGYPNTMLHEVGRQAAFTFAQDGPHALDRPVGLSLRRRVALRAAERPTRSVTPFFKVRDMERKAASPAATDHVPNGESQPLKLTVRLRASREVVSAERTKRRKREAVCDAKNRLRVVMPPLVDKDELRPGPVPVLRQEGGLTHPVVLRDGPHDGFSTPDVTNSHVATSYELRPESRFHPAATPF